MKKTQPNQAHGLAFATLLVMAACSWANAQPGQGIRLGSGMISPFIDGDVTYDSNVHLAPADAKADTFFDGTVGLRGGYTGYALDMSGFGFLNGRNYVDQTDMNFSAMGEFLKLKYGTRDRFVIAADQSLRKIEDNDRYGSEAAVGGVSPDSVLDVSSRERRTLNQAGLSVGRDLTDKTDFDLGYLFDSVRYDDPARLDLSSHNGRAESSHQLTDKTAGLLTLQYGRQNDDQSGASANYYAARAGLKTKGTDKVTFKAGLGAQAYDRNSDAGNDKTTSFNFDGLASWLATDKIVVQAGGLNGIQLSSLYANNASEFYVFWLGTAYRFIPSTSLSLAGSYRVDNYLDPVPFNGTTVDREDKGLGVRVRVDYQAPAAFLKLFSEVSQEAVDSNVNLSDYDRTRVAIGATLTY